jgi:hypothetical protein
LHERGHQRVRMRGCGAVLGKEERAHEERGPGNSTARTSPSESEPTTGSVPDF